ncbi:hypothetical protein Ancab_011065 [Ancistrocladus abbreviatus]
MKVVFRMNLCLPGEGSDEITDFQKEHGSAVDGELDLNCPMDRKGSLQEKENFQVDLNKFDHHESYSQPANMMQEDMESSYGNSNSHMQARYHGYHSNKWEDYLQVKSCSHGAIFHGNGGDEAKDTLHLQDSLLRADANGKQRLNLKESPEMGRLSPPFHDKNACRFHSGSLKAELPDRSYQELEGYAAIEQIGKLSSSLSPSLGADGAENETLNQLTESPVEEVNMNVPDSGQQSSRRVPQVPFSPSVVGHKSVLPLKSDDMSLSAHGEKSSSLHHGGHDKLHSPKSHRQKRSSSLKRYGLEKRISSCEDFYPTKETFASSKRSSQQRASPLRDGSASQRTQKCGRNDRSRSQSPVRRRDSSFRYDKGYHDRPPSRSPYSRNLHKRSARYSPRQRSPLGHPIRHRSPRKRPWSPPPNRSTGLGKPGRHLFVAGFEFLTTEGDLERKFSRFGHVCEVRIVRDKRSGDSRGFAFLSMERDEEADAAIKALDETEWNGRIILVEKSRTSGH